MTPKEVFSQAYEAAHAKIWAEYDAGMLTLDQALDRLLKAWRKAANHVRRSTGHGIWVPE